MLKIFRVNGNSMNPDLNHGDFVLALTPKFLVRPRCKPGKLAVFRDPQFGTLIKRVHGVLQDGGYLFAGDAEDSLSPEAIGRVDISQICGLVLFAVRKDAVRKDAVRKSAVRKGAVRKESAVSDAVQAAHSNSSKPV